MAFARHLALGLIGLALATGASAAVVDGLYDGTVPGDGASAARAATAGDALRQVVVRVTGRGAAAGDPLLAPLYADALRYAQSYRAVPGGQVVVGFDGRAIESALLAAGQRLWPAQRLATLVLLVSDRAGAGLAGAADPEVRHELERVARERGVPLVWAGGLDAATQSARQADALAGRLEALNAYGRTLGAEGLLLGRLTAAGSSWSWTGPAGAGVFTGPAAEALAQLADRYGALYAVDSARVAGSARILVRGVRDLAGYALAGQAVGALGSVTEVAVEEAAGDQLWLRVRYSGDEDSLRRALTASGRFVADGEAAADGLVHVVLVP